MALSEKQMVMNIKGRINDELVPLKERITGLERAIKYADQEQFEGKCVRYRSLMKRQLVAMREYADMLEARLTAVEEFRAA
ncbi:TPA: crAss001_48 related protein [Aeromonas veronii]